MSADELKILAYDLADEFAKARIALERSPQAARVGALESRVKEVRQAINARKE